MAILKMLMSLFSMLSMAALWTLTVIIAAFWICLIYSIIQDKCTNKRK